MKLYRHLAWDGIRKNSRLYVPYLLTGVGAVSFFYILVALSRLPEGTLPGSGSVQVIWAALCCGCFLCCCCFTPIPS